MNGCVAMIVFLTVLLAIGGGIGTGINKIITSTHENNEKIALEKQHLALEKQRKLIIEEFTKNKEEIIADIKKEISAKNYELANTKSKKYLPSGDEAIKKLHSLSYNKLAIERLLTQISIIDEQVKYSEYDIHEDLRHLEEKLYDQFGKTLYKGYIPSETPRKKQDLYEALLRLDPKNKIYQKKFQAFSNYWTIFDSDGQCEIFRNAMTEWMKKTKYSHAYVSEDGHLGTTALLDGDFLWVAGIYVHNIHRYKGVIKIRGNAHIS